MSVNQIHKNKIKMMSMYNKQLENNCLTLQYKGTYKFYSLDYPQCRCQEQINNNMALIVVRASVVLI